MPVHIINRNTMNDDLVDNEITLSKKVISKIIGYINQYYVETNIFDVKLFIDIHMLEDLFSQYNFVMPPTGKFIKDCLVGKLAGTNVYISELLDEFEIFIGESERELEILKRNKKITKLLER